MALHQLIGPLHVSSWIDDASTECPIGELERLEITLLKELYQLFDHPLRGRPIGRAAEFTLEENEGEKERLGKLSIPLPFGVGLRRNRTSVHSDRGS